jgi:Flp pilus assembly protein TadD
LVIAKDDASRRPHGATLAALARAQLLTGDPSGALATIERARKGGWSSSLLLLQQAEANDALGRGDDAASAREEALKLNPHITDPAARFIWFGHD